MSVIIKEFSRDVRSVNNQEITIKTLRCVDKDGDDFDVDIQIGSYVELSIHHPSGCLVLSPSQARELANKILAEMPAGEE